MTVPETDYGPVDWLQRLLSEAVHGAARFPHFQVNPNYREMADLARDIQDLAFKMEKKALDYWKGADRVAAIRTTTVAQDAIWNEGVYNVFSAEARKKNLEIVHLTEDLGYQGPAVIVDTEPVYIHGENRHEMFSCKTLRREFNGKWLLYPDRWWA